LNNNKQMTMPSAHVSDASALAQSLEDSESFDYNTEQRTTTTATYHRSPISAVLPLSADEASAILLDRQRQSHKKIKTVLERCDETQRLVALLERRFDNLETCLEDLQRGQGSLQQDNHKIQTTLSGRSTAIGGESIAATMIDDCGPYATSSNASDNCFSAPWTALLNCWRQMRRQPNARDNKKDDEAADILLHPLTTHFSTNSDMDYDDASDATEKKNASDVVSYVHAVNMERGSAPIRRHVASQRVEQ